MTDAVEPVWPGAEGMNPFEAVMWRLDAAPMLRVPTLSCEELDVVPDWDRFLAAHEWAVRMAPQFKYKVVEPALGLGTPRWTVDPHFDLSFHIRRQRLPEGGGWAELFEALAQFFATPLDRSRPLWEIVLYSGLPEGRAIYALKMHHAMADGHAVMQLLSRLHSRTREPSPGKPVPAGADADPELNELDALFRQLRADAEAVPNLGRKLGSAVLRGSTNPLGGARAVARYGASLRRVVAPPVGAGSPLLTGRSMSMRLSLIDVPFSDFRAAAKAAGGSVNDAFLAALLGGYRRYHEAMGAPVVDSIPLGFPISLRKPGDTTGGNRIAAARIPGPLAEPDPVARVARIRELSQAARNEPAIDVMGVASPALARLPVPVLTAVAGPLTTSLQLMASNVPGFGRGHYLAGAEVLRFFGYGRSGAAALVTFITSGDLASVGVGFDPAAITEPALFLECLVDGFVELLDLHPGSAKPLLRG